MYIYIKLQEADIPNIKLKMSVVVYFKEGFGKVSCDNENTIFSSSSASRVSNGNSAVSQRRKCEKQPAYCMFCQKTKLVKGTNTKEKLYLCVEMRAHKVICEARLFYDNERIAALCSGDLIAKEAAFHKTCYRDSTRIVTREKLDTKKDKNDSLVDNLFGVVQDDIMENEKFRYH